MKNPIKTLTVFGPIMLLVFVLGTIATALTVERISLDRLTREADLIIHGTVHSSYAQWEGQNIYTYTRIGVSGTLKGKGASEVTVKQLGGAVGDIHAIVDGTPELLTNDELVLFLREWNGNYWIHSIVLGKFSVDRSSGIPVAISDLNNVGLIDPATGREITESGAKRNVIELPLLFDQIRTIRESQDREGGR